MTTFEDELRTTQHVNKGVSMKDLRFNPVKKTWIWAGNDYGERFGPYDEITGLDVDWEGIPKDMSEDISDDALNTVIDKRNDEGRKREAHEYDELRSARVPYHRRYDPYIDDNSYTTAYFNDFDERDEDNKIDASQYIQTLQAMDYPDDTAPPKRAAMIKVAKKRKK